jgi:hypothetical protein
MDLKRAQPMRVPTPSLLLYSVKANRKSTKKAKALIQIEGAGCVFVPCQQLTEAYFETLDNAFKSHRLYCIDFKILYMGNQIDQAVGKLASWFTMKACIQDSMRKCVSMGGCQETLKTQASFANRGVHF